MNHALITILAMIGALTLTLGISVSMLLTFDKLIAAKKKRDLYRLKSPRWVHRL